MVFTLTLQIAPQDLMRILETNQRITLAQPINGGSPNVAWLVFQPLESNQVEWDTASYGVYAANPDLSNGAPVQSTNTLYPLQSGSVTTYENDATFSSRPGYGPGSFQVINQSQQDLAFGLQQSAVVNGQPINPSPVNASQTPPFGSAEFMPESTVLVCLQSQYEARSFMGYSQESYTTVSLLSANQSLVYNAAMNQFVPNE